MEQECEKMTDTENLVEERARRISQLEGDVAHVGNDLKKATEHRKNLEIKLAQTLDEKKQVEDEKKHIETELNDLRLAIAMLSKKQAISNLN
ncbi:hypothetical protein BD770DRAFT_399351 [Pilaira anomala]|nr:hypothetical protein BD770DRAFT_399351 [Pilaira anomala]